MTHPLPRLEQHRSRVSELLAHAPRHLSLFFLRRIDNFEIDHRLIEQLVRYFAECARTRETCFCPLKLAIEVVEDTVTPRLYFEYRHYAAIVVGDHRQLRVHLAFREPAREVRFLIVYQHVSDCEAISLEGNIRAL